MFEQRDGIHKPAGLIWEPDLDSSLPECRAIEDELRDCLYGCSQRALGSRSVPEISVAVAWLAAHGVGVRDV
jgi:hypothetical protein